MSGISFTAFCLFAALQSISGGSVQQNPESLLRRDLFKDYDKLVRPVSDAGNAVPTHVSITPIRIRELNDKDQVLVLDSWIMMRWKDDFLRWSPADYNGIQTFNLPIEEIWRPDVTVYTATPDTSFLPRTLTSAVINNTGDVIWVPPFTISSHCPFESDSKKRGKYQQCNIKLGSWTYSERQLDLLTYSDQVDLSNFQDSNPDWTLVDAAQDRESKYYPCCPDPYPSINFNITLRQRASLPNYKPQKAAQEISTYLEYLKNRANESS